MTGGDKKRGRLNPQELKNMIMQLFRRNPKKRFDAAQLQSKLKVKNTKESIQEALDKLEQKQALIPVPVDKYKLNHSDMPQGEVQTAVGRVDMTRNGSAYIICEGLDNDIYVTSRKLNYALDGDTVTVKYLKKSDKTRYEGEIVDIIERNASYFIGTLRVSPRFGFVTPDKQNMFTDIFVPLEDLGEAKDGDKVVVKVVRWQTAKIKSPIGKVTETLGKAGSSDIEMKSILIQNGFELSFPEAVIEESEALPERISAEEIAKRLDYREVLTFTIDPKTAKDFDDAISFQYLDADGNYEVGVHIADVSHYVQEGSELDKEALNRSTSVYLVDRVLPMLPEKISNILCSLRPNEDKLAFSAVFTFNKNDKLVGEWFGKTVIHSNRRFTYEEAQEILEKGEGELAEELLKLNGLAIKLRKQRFEEGSVDFGGPEVRFELDDEGVPIAVYLKERKDSNMLIEDFMLLANRKVAVRVGKRENAVPFVYRIHDLPDMLKVADFVRFAQALDYRMNIQTPEQIAAAYTKMIQDAKERPELKILEPLAIRTMAKAVYSTDNIGHYGLGFDYYTHFTSPIRRYSDVLVHRILEKNLEGEYRVKKEELEQQCKHISQQERNATDAERQSIKYKQVEFMTKHIGQTFVGVISGMIERGFFVELIDNYCEGMVDFKTLPDSYTLDDSRLFAVGRGDAAHKKIRMGDQVLVRIISADLTKRNIDMELVVE